MSLPHRILAATLMAAGVALLPAESSAGCTVRLTAFDAAGLPVARGHGYGTGADGTVLAPLSIATAGVQRWSRLMATVDPPGRDPGSGAPIEAVVELVRRIDRDHDLALLGAPGLPPCADPPAGHLPGPETSDGSPAGLDRDPATRPSDATGSAPPPFEPVPGMVLPGVRERRGYRTREFRAVVERSLQGPGGAGILMARLLDPGGAESGLLFDSRGSLVGFVLPPPPEGDPDRIAVLLHAIDDGHPAGPVAPLRDALVAVAAAGAPPVRRFAQAMLIDRDHQAGRALELLEETARAAGEFDDLLLERGILRFRVGRTEMAIEDFSRVAARAPGRHAAHYNLGMALGSAGRFADAIAAFRAAAAIDPAHAGTRFQTALALAALGDSRAREEHEALRSLDPRLAADLDAILSFP